MVRVDTPGTWNKGCPPYLLASSFGVKMELLHFASFLQSVNGLTVPSFFWSAKHQAQRRLLALYGKPNSLANHSKSPVIAHTIPFLIFLPLPSSMPLPSLSFLGVCPSNKHLKLQASHSMTTFPVAGVADCFGQAAIINWLSEIALWVKRHLKLITWRLSTSVKGAPSPCST